VLLDLFANAPIDAPARTAILDDRAVAFEPHMADLNFTRRCAMVEPAINDKSAANATANVYPKDWIETNARAVSRFTECGGVGVVLDNRWQPAQRVKPFREWKIAPSFDVMRLHNSTCAPIDRPTVANANGLRLPLGEECRERRCDLRANAFAARRAIDHETPPIEDASGFIAGGELQFRAANFNREQMHGKESATCCHACRALPIADFAA
jgi:hypothetical protein